MKRSLILASCLLVTAWSSAAVLGGESAAEGDVPPVLNFTMESLDGTPVHLKKYQGKVVLFVNVASRCGNTPQYSTLQMLHDKYAKQGLAVVGVPCNQFGAQEPGSAQQIAEFCSSKYGVTFDMLSKVDVNGENACELYKYLTSEEAGKATAGKIKWNFEKFLIGRDGKIVARFSPRTKPDSPEVISTIEQALKSN